MGGAGRGYSEFCLLHKLGLFLGVKNFEFYYCGYYSGCWPFAGIFWGSLSKLTILWGLSKFSVLFLGYCESRG